MVDRRIDMSLLAILVFTGTMVLSLWATIRVRQVYSKFSLLPASARSSGAETAVRILHQEGIYDVEIVKHDQALGDHYDPTHKRLVLITLPVEFDASARARLVLRETGLIRTAEEDTAVAQVLRLRLGPMLPRSSPLWLTSSYTCCLSWEAPGNNQYSLGQYNRKKNAYV